MAYDSEISQKSRDLIVLEKARERIARGWCQRQCYDNYGGVCIVGAVGEVLFGTGEENQPYLQLLGFHLPDSNLSAAQWNDAPGRTKAEVLARFDAAIERLRA